MELIEFAHDLNINLDRLDKICYQTEIIKRVTPYKHKIITSAFRQIAVNLDHINRNFDKLPIEEIASLVRKNAVKKYLSGISTNTNPDHMTCYIEKHNRQQMRAKLLYIQNRLLEYISDNTITAASTTYTATCTAHNLRA